MKNKIFNRKYVFPCYEDLDIAEMYKIQKALLKIMQHALDNSHKSGFAEAMENYTSVLFDLISDIQLKHIRNKWVIKLC